MHFIPHADSLMWPIKKGHQDHHNGNIKLHALLQLERHSGLRNAAILFSSQFTCTAGRSGQKAEMVGHPHLGGDQPSSKDIGCFKKTLIKLQTCEFQILPISSFRFIPHCFLCQCFSSFLPIFNLSDYRNQGLIDIKIPDAWASRDCHCSLGHKENRTTAPGQCHTQGISAAETKEFMQKQAGFLIIL